MGNIMFWWIVSVTKACRIIFYIIFYRGYLVFICTTQRICHNFVWKALIYDFNKLIIGIIYCNLHELRTANTFHSRVRGGNLQTTRTRGVLTKQGTFIGLMQNISERRRSVSFAVSTFILFYIVILHCYFTSSYNARFHEHY